MECKVEALFRCKRKFSAKSISHGLHLEDMAVIHHVSDEGNGPVLVLIHGAYIDSTIWTHQLDHFRKNYRVINYDLRGHGLTLSSEQHEEYSVELFAQDLFELLQKSGIQRVFLCGLSLGSMIAQAFSAKHPEMCDGIILVGTSASYRNTWIERIALTVIFPRWFAYRVFDRLSTRQFMKTAFFMTWFVYGRKWIGQSETRKLIRKSMQRMHRSEIKKVFAALHQFRKQDLFKGDFPVLLVIGEYDSRLLHFHSKQLHRMLRTRSKLVEMQAAGHACNVDKPEQFNALIDGWMKQIRPAERLAREVIL